MTAKFAIPRIDIHLIEGKPSGTIRHSIAINGVQHGEIINITKNRFMIDIKHADGIQPAPGYGRSYFSSLIDARKAVKELYKNYYETTCDSKTARNYIVIKDEKAPDGTPYFADWHFDITGIGDCVLRFATRQEAVIAREEYKANGGDGKWAVAEIFPSGEWKVLERFQ